MPYIYAIEEKVYADGIPPKEGEWKHYTVEYNIVPEPIAQTHEDGCYKLVTHTGHDATSWSRFYNSYREEDTTKVGTGKPLKDALGQELAGGDFVMATSGTYTSLHIMEVVNFTPKKIRVRSVGGFGMGSPKNPSDVVKVDKSLFF